jgi:hypothetical protein
MASLFNKQTICEGGKTYDLNKLLGDYIIKARQQMIDLFFDGRMQPICGGQLYEFALVLLCYWECFPAGF